MISRSNRLRILSDSTWFLFWKTQIVHEYKTVYSPHESVFDWCQIETMNFYLSIDENWCYHEILLTFEHVTNFHTRIKLAKIMQDIITRHKLKERIYIITNENVKNNFTMHEELMLLLCTRMFNNIDTNVQNSKKISCFAHVI
jgi:hypothetical protein